jgi:hypothetical protein
MSPEPLTERVRCDEGLELPDDDLVTSRGQLRLDASLDRDQAKLVEPDGLRPSPVLGRELGHRRTTPQAERHLERTERFDRVRPGRLGQTKLLLEPTGVDPVGGDFEHIAGGAGHESSLAGRVRATREIDLSSEPREVTLQRRDGATGWFVTPQHPHELVDRHHRIAMHQEHGQNKARFGAPERKDETVVRDTDRAQQSELHPHIVAKVAGRRTLRRDLTSR